MFKDIVKASRSYRGYDESYRFSREELEGPRGLRAFCTVQRERPSHFVIIWHGRMKK